MGFFKVSALLSHHLQVNLDSLFVFDLVSSVCVTLGIIPFHLSYLIC
jgi:hypothetical protein